MNHQKIAFDKVNIAHCPNIHINRMTYFIGLCLNWLFFRIELFAFCAQMRANKYINGWNFRHETIWPEYHEWKTDIPIGQRKSGWSTLNQFQVYNKFGSIGQVFVAKIWAYTNYPQFNFFYISLSSFTFTFNRSSSPSKSTWNFSSRIFRKSQIGTKSNIIRFKDHSKCQKRYSGCDGNRIKKKFGGCCVQ